MSMVSYYGSGMYRHQNAVPGTNGHFQNNVPMPWYSGYPHQPPPPQIPAAPGQYNPCMEEQQMWHHHGGGGAPPNSHHSMFPHEYPDYVTGQSMHGHLEPENQLPSPPITVSGSEMSSPGAGGNISPPNQSMARPAQARSPFEWIKKNNYQSQPNPGKTRTKDKYRVVYTDHQRIELEKEFTFNNKYITIRRKSELAVNLGLSERQIKIWFQNRRAKERKQNKKRNEEKHQIDMSGTGSVSLGGGGGGLPAPYQHNLMGQSLGQQMDMVNGLPPMMTNPSVVMQKFMDSQGMKLEPCERDQMG